MHSADVGSGGVAVDDQQLVIGTKQRTVEAAAAASTSRSTQVVGHLQFKDHQARQKNNNVYNTVRLILT
jgi:hypothetical protein